MPLVGGLGDSLEEILVCVLRLGVLSVLGFRLDDPSYTGLNHEKPNILVVGTFNREIINSLLKKYKKQKIR